jgi:hypothetical protein
MQLSSNYSQEITYNDVLDLGYYEESLISRDNIKDRFSTSLEF